MDNQTNESRAAYNAERCKSQRRYQPAADSYGRSVESAVKEDENQGGNADVEAQMIIIEKNPSDALFPREHSKRKKCEQRRHTEPRRGPAQENPCHQECSEHR